MTHPIQTSQFSVRLVWGLAWLLAQPTLWVHGAPFKELAPQGPAPASPTATAIPSVLKTKPVVATPTPAPVASGAAVASESPVTSGAPVATGAPVVPEVPAAAAPSTPPPQQPTLADGPPSMWENPGQTQAVAPLRFNRVEPGVTPLSEVRTLWGDPVKELQRDGQQIWAYKVAGFRQVDVIATDQRVDSVLVHLLQPLPVDHVLLDLGLREVRPVLIPDSVGNVLGQAFPERGVLLNYTQEADQMLVAEILLEPVRGELFRLRAEYDFTWNYQHDLDDMQQAVKLDPEDHRAQWQLATLLMRGGQFREATEIMEPVAAAHSTMPRYQTTLAILLAQQGKVPEAIRRLRAVLEQEQAQTLEKAEAHLALGDLLAMGPKPQYPTAMEHHLKAIQLAVETAGAEQFEVRRWAKQTLIRAHLSTARDIAGGYFQRQSEVVPKWLERAQRLATEYLERDQGDPSLRMELYRGILEAYALLPTEFDPSVAIDQTLADGRKLIADHADPRFQQRVEWEMTQALFQAGEIERALGNGDRALQFANNAVALFENAKTGRDGVPAERALEGQLYFLLGALQAVHRQDHTEAVKWFDKAEPFLREATTPSRFADYGLNGERFVSMGVSFWETHQQQRAIDTTLHGITLIKQAINDSTLNESSLSVPYGNLATMHQNMGNANAAKKYAQMMAQAEKADSATVQR